MMPKIFLYAHGGSGNHGCEAIVRSTIKILGINDATLISSKPDEDIFYGLDKICEIVKDTSGALKRTDIDFWKAYLALKFKGDYLPMDKMRYKEAFGLMSEGDIAISIGGDNYCYADVQKYVMLHDMLKDRGVKTVLWGCSVEPEVASRPQIAADLARYDLITARESITYQALKEINPRTILVSDPAFQLDAKETSLPENFVVGNTVGINLSPMAEACEKIPGITQSNYVSLIEYILNQTDMSIAFIPHVIWDGGDDRIPLQKLYGKYKGTGRVCLIDDMNCQELKYIISKCRFFVGARTHSTIAAYSTGVPTLVLGYSVKSRGIARDLFGKESGYVVPVQALRNEFQISDVFIKMVENETKEKRILHSNLQSYITSDDAIRERLGIL